MSHLLLTYDGLLFAVGISASLFIYLAGRRLRFLASFFWFFALFTLNYFLSVILGYIGINLKDIPPFFNYLSSGMTGAVNIAALFFAAESIHRFYGSMKLWRTIAIGIAMGISTILMLLPWSVAFIAEGNLLRFRFGYFLSSGMYLCVVAYVIGIHFFNWKKLIPHPHRWFGFFMLVFAGFGFTESLINYVSCLKTPIRKITYASGFFSLSSIPFLVISIYMIRFCIKLINAPGNQEKRFDEIVRTCKISGREEAVIKLVLEGLDNQRIADALFISLSTVKTHINNIFRKTGATNRFELARYFDGPSPPKV